MAIAAYARSPGLPVRQGAAEPAYSLPVPDPVRDRRPAERVIEGVVIGRLWRGAAISTEEFLRLRGLGNSGGNAAKPRFRQTYDGMSQQLTNSPGASLDLYA